MSARAPVGLVQEEEEEENPMIWILGSRQCTNLISVELLGRTTQVNNSVVFFMLRFELNNNNADARKCHVYEPLLSWQLGRGAAL